MSANTKKYLGYGLIGLVIILVLGLLITSQTPRTFTDFKVVNTNKEAMDQQLKNNRTSGLTYEFIYKPGCSDCKHIEKDTIKPIYKLQRQKKLMVFNAKNKKTYKYLITNQVTNTPTLIVKQQGYTIYQYAGRNPKVFNTLLQGKNPQNGKNLEQSGKPSQEIVRNDFNHYKATTPAMRFNTLAKLD